MGKLKFYYDADDHDDEGYDQLEMPKVVDQYGSNLPWDDMRQQIYEIEFTESVKDWEPTSFAYWFYNMQYITELDLSNVNMATVTDVRHMFEACAHLKTIYVGEASTFDKDKITSYEDIFKGDLKLVGGNGTKYRSGLTSSDYLTLLRVDAAGTSGYLSTGNVNFNKVRLAVIYELNDEGCNVLDAPDDSVFFVNEDEADDYQAQISDKKPIRDRTVWENLKCWYAIIDGNMVIRYPGQKVPLGLKSQTGKTTLVANAIWEPPYIYGINYLSEGTPSAAACDFMPENQYYETIDEEELTHDFVVPEIAPRSLGYEFKG